MRNSIFNRGVFTIITAFFAISIFAQDETTPLIEQIIVTAGKTESTLLETPLSVSVVTSEELEQSQVRDIKDLQFLVPSLRVTQLQSSGNTNFLIRGFGNGANNAGIEPSVGVFVDGVYRSRTASALFDLPNLDRIEVLRGPQSTLFGKNASAGVISIVTAKPSLQETTGSTSLTVGAYNQILVKADVNGPLSDTVGFSLSGSYSQRDGYYEDLHGGGALGELNRHGVRGQLLFVPSDELEIRVIADYNNFDEACCGVANLFNGPTGAAVMAIGGNLVPNSPFAYQGYYDFMPVNEFQTDGVSIQFDYDISDAVSLTSITAVRSLSRFDNIDVDFTSAPLLDKKAGNTTDTEIDTLTQEFRLTGSTDSMDWMLGAYMFDEKIDQLTGLLYGTGFRPYADILAGGIPGASPLNALEAAVGLPSGTFHGQGQGVTEDSAMDNDTLSIFGQVDIPLSDRVTLTLGVNHTKDKKSVVFDSTGTDIFSGLDLEKIGYWGLLAGLNALNPGGAANAPTALALSTVKCSATAPPPACNPLLGLQPLQFLLPNVDFPNSVESGRSDDGNTTGTLRFAFDISDAINMYVSVGTGFKATSWNLSRDSRPFAKDKQAIEAAGLNVANLYYATRFASPEESTVYELGLKARWETVALNVAVFDQSIEGFQSNIFNGTGFSLSNAGKQSVSGVEVDLRWQPTAAFQGLLAVTFLDPLYDSFPGAQGVNGVTDLSGTKPPGIHELSLTAVGRYNFSVGNAEGFARAEYIYENRVPIVENVPEGTAWREVNTINASVGLAWDSGLELTLWGRNITNDEYLLSAFPSPAQGGSYSGYPNQPRTYGLTVSKYFD
jgi:outer membrane receptor protein involved in Fe transport